VLKRCRLQRGGGAQEQLFLRASLELDRREAGARGAVDVQRGCRGSRGEQHCRAHRHDPNPCISDLFSEPFPSFIWVQSNDFCKTLTQASRSNFQKIREVGRISTHSSKVAWRFLRILGMHICGMQTSRKAGNPFQGNLINKM
jgi:hypothetical protein